MLFKFDYRKVISLGELPHPVVIDFASRSRDAPRRISIDWHAQNQRFSFKLGKCAEQEFQVSPFACSSDPCAKRRIPRWPNYVERFGFLVVGVGRSADMHLVRMDRSQPIWDRPAFAQDVNERFKMILQIEHDVLQLTHRPDSHENDAVHWTTGSEAPGAKLEQPIFCQGVGEL